jgi:hypothetical protein
MVAGGIQPFNVEFADDRFIIHHENAMGTACLALKRCRARRGRLLDLVILHGTIIDCKSLGASWGEHPIFRQIETA